MANLRRRSARLSKTSTGPSSVRKTPASKARLESLVERDETPDIAQQSIDEVLATPTTTRTVRNQLSELSGLRTPQTEPKAEQAEMDPKTIHRSTAKAPDSGLKLGFSDIKTDRSNDTPSKSALRENVHTSPAFEFRFSSDSHLSNEARMLMETVREDAAKIKAQMLAEKAAQDQKDQDENTMFGAGRKIAKPKGRAGRFSDVHMAQFKKMDSIANHASAYRARQGYGAPTTQSLKRSPSKAGLDEPERPRTAGKGTPGRSVRIPPPVIGRPASVSPFRSVNTATSSSRPGPAKRARKLPHQDVTDSRQASTLSAPSQPSTLYSPTKSSLARLSQVSISPEKPSMIPRSKSARSLQSTAGTESMVTAFETTSRSLGAKPLPALPAEQTEPLYPDLPPSPSKSPSVAAKQSSFTSKLPTLSGLRSILRGGRKAATTEGRPGTPKRPNTVNVGSESARKVDFTPSVKSRHAVKLATDNPSPAKIRRDTPFKASQPVIPYDSSAYVIDDHEDYGWEEQDSEIAYPALPSTDELESDVQVFQDKAREINRRESKEFKSIFTNLHPSRNESATLTSINTVVNRTDPEIHANRVLRSPSNPPIKPSPSTIRRIHNAGSTQLVRPFEDKLENVPYGLSEKKRRHESLHDNEKHGIDEDAKENQRISEMPRVPGGWQDSTGGDAEKEETVRASKRPRRSAAQGKPLAEKSPVKKQNAARETAAKNARERKGRGVLSLSRLNMLSRPKSRA